MRFLSLLPFLLFAGFLMMGTGCANIVPPGGGDKDTSAPKLVQVDPADSQFNALPQKLTLRFDEYVVLNDPGKEVQISPMLDVPLTLTSKLREVMVRIPDTLLRKNTTYRISFGKAIADLHENNPFRNYTYTFSTGAYFDSLKLRGRVQDAASGLPDTSSFLLLYDVAAGDSAVVRHKPLYISRTDAQGNFSFDGLPAGTFNLYALTDKNGNYIYDGAGESIAFLDKSVVISADSVQNVQLYSFTEPEDTAHATTSSGTDASSRLTKNVAPPTKSENNATKVFSYVINADSSDLKKRTFDINKPLNVVFSHLLQELSEAHIFLSYDSAGTTIEADKKVVIDSSDRKKMIVSTTWKEDVVYTIRLQKGFARDTSGTEALPARYSFRTKRSEDYAKLQIHLPARMYHNDAVLQVTNDHDTIYQHPVTDTMITLNQLMPGIYTFRVIHDSNGNGVWDRGNLFLKKQPEKVEAYSMPVTLKAGWENIIDFDETSRRKTIIGPPPPASDTAPH